MTTFDFISILLDAFFVAGLIWSSFTDLQHRKISNACVLLLLCLGLTRTFLSLTAGSTVWYLHPFGLLFGFPFYIGWRLHKVGGGDVKLAAVLGLYLGLPACVILVIFMLPILFAYYLFLHTSKTSTAMAPIFSLAAIAMLILQYFIFR